MFFPCSYHFTSPGRMTGFCLHLVSYGENQSGLQHRLKTSENGRLVRKMVSSLLSSEFWTVLSQADKQRGIFLSVSLIEHLPDPFWPCLKHVIVVFMAIFLPLWFPFITIGFQITHVWGKGGKYFCVVTLFCSNTYKGEGWRSLEPFWGQS